MGECMEEIETQQRIRKIQSAKSGYLTNISKAKRITGSPNSVEVRWTFEFIRECLKINKIRLKVKKRKHLSGDRGLVTGDF